MSTVRKAGVSSTPQPIAEKELKLEFLDVPAEPSKWTAPPARFQPKDKTEFPSTGPSAAARLRPLPGPPSAAPALAYVLSKAAGTRDSAQLLAQLPELSDSLRAFAPQAQGATPVEQEKIAHAALRHYAVKSGRPLPPALLQTLGGSNEAIASAYAKDLGFQGVQRQGQGFVLLGAKDAPMPLKAGSGSIAELGKALNEARFSTASATPPLAAVDVTKPQFGLDEAHLAVHLASLAYQPKEVVQAQLEKWGFDVSTFKWIENKATDTQGFVVADKKGNVFPVFRGTVSGQDWGTNVQSLMGSPSWKGNTELKTHHGFTKAFDSVWPEMKAAIQQAQTKAGPNAKVMFAGHSLGGALTQLAAVRAGLEGLVKPENASIYTIGSPRVGNEAFKSTLEGMYPKAFRIANYEEGIVDRQDLVTQVPPKSMGFRHAGEMIKLGSDTLTVTDRSSATAELVDPEADDPINAELESLRGPELERRMKELMGQPTAGAPPAQETAEANGFQVLPAVVPSVLAHSSGVYLERIAQHAIERR